MIKIDLETLEWEEIIVDGLVTPGPTAYGQICAVAYKERVTCSFDELSKV